MTDQLKAQLILIAVLLVLLALCGTGRADTAAMANEMLLTDLYYTAKNVTNLPQSTAPVGNLSPSWICTTCTFPNVNDGKPVECCYKEPQK